MSQRALITGTSSGIGLDTAIVLAEAGFDVVATMRNLDKRGPLEAAAKERGVSVEIRPLDVSIPESITSCIESVGSELGPIDVLVNNAGFGRLGSVRHVMGANFFGVWNTTRAVLPGMRERGRGRIVSVTSVGGLIGQPFNDAYCAAKFAVEGMMEALAPVARELGIHVSIIEPGPVNTEFVSSTRALSADLLAQGAPGYESMIANYAAATTDVFASYGQTGEDIACIIRDVLGEERPHLRYLTSDYVKAIAEQKYVDTTGDGIVDIFQSRLRPGA
jgi:NAD(P)-dependent dehydrogenase (short-subunit alcohol dehydrogenase family)